MQKDKRWSTATKASWLREDWLCELPLWGNPQKLQPPTEYASSSQ